MRDYLNLFGISIHPFSRYATPLNIQIHRPISMPGISSERGTYWFSWMKVCWVLDFVIGVKHRILGRNDELLWKMTFQKGTLLLRGRGSYCVCLLHPQSPQGWSTNKSGWVWHRSGQTNFAEI